MTGVPGVRSMEAFSRLPLFAFTSSFALCTEITGESATFTDEPVSAASA
jgi:hypothetical protein